MSQRNIGTNFDTFLEDEGLLEETGANPDRMPLDQGVRQELPEESIR